MPDMKSIKYIFLFLISVLGIQVRAQTVSDGILWKVTGNGLKKPSYIFGTIHVYNDSSLTRKQVIKSSLKSTDVLVTEINLASYDELIAVYKASMDTSTRSMKDRFNAVQYKTIDSVCKIYLGVGLADLDHKYPFTLMSMIITSQKFLGTVQPVVIDMEITQLANAMAKEVYGLETFRFQDSLIKSIPEQNSDQWLYDLCSDINKTKTEMTEMMKLYSQQKSKELYKYIMATSPEMTLMKDVLLTDRNLAWANFMNDNMKEVSLFVAVGAGHLAGQDGLIALLKAKGYTVTPVIIK